MNTYILVMLLSFISVAYPQTTSVDNTRFKAVFIQQPPYVFLRNLTDATATVSSLSTIMLTNTSYIDGFFVDLILELQRRLGRNVSTSIYVVPDGLFGAFNNATKQWTGVVGELARSNADFFIGPLTITNQRQSVLNFTSTFTKVGFRVLVSKKQSEVDWIAFLRPFTYDLWLCIAAISVVMGLLLIFVDKFSPYGCRKEEETGVSGFFLNSILVTIGGNGSPTIWTPAWSGKILILGFFFFALSMLLMYTANVTAKLVLPDEVPTVRSLSELQQRKLPFGVLSNTAISSFFLSTQQEQYRDMVPQMVIYPTLNAALDSLRRKEIAALIHTNVILDYLLTQEPCDTLTLAELFNIGYYGIALRPGFPFREQFSQTLLTMQEDGFISNIFTKWYVYSSTCIPPSISALTVTELAGLFLMLVVFIGLSFLVLGAEHLLQHIRKAKKQ